MQSQIPLPLLNARLYSFPFPSPRLWRPFCDAAMPHQRPWPGISTEIWLRGTFCSPSGRAGGGLRRPTLPPQIRQPFLFFPTTRKWHDFTNLTKYRVFLQNKYRLWIDCGVHTGLSINFHLICLWFYHVSVNRKDFKAHFATVNHKCQYLWKENKGERSTDTCYNMDKPWKH